MHSQSHLLSATLMLWGTRDPFILVTLSSKVTWACPGGALRPVGWRSRKMRPGWSSAKWGLSCQGTGVVKLREKVYDWAYSEGPATVVIINLYSLGSHSPATLENEVTPTDAQILHGKPALTRHVWVTGAWRAVTWLQVFLAWYGTTMYNIVLLYTGHTKMLHVSGWLDQLIPTI